MTFYICYGFLHIAKSRFNTIQYIFMMFLSFFQKKAYSRGCMNMCSFENSCKHWVIHVHKSRDRYYVLEMEAKLNKNAHHTRSKKRKTADKNLETYYAY